jgi:hypothetical protein
LLGVLYAALGAFNNVAMRRGAVTGSVLQGMAVTVPIGGLSFLVMTVAFGELGQLVMFPSVARQIFEQAVVQQLNSIRAEDPVDGAQSGDSVELAFAILEP